MQRDGGRLGLLSWRWLLITCVVLFQSEKIVTPTNAFTHPQPTISSPSSSSTAYLPSRKITSSLQLRESSTSDNDDNDDDDYQEKFGFQQRLDSGKSFVVGAVVGSVAVTLPNLIHQVVLTPLLNLPGDAGLAQFEFDTDAAGLLTGLFAIVYRYGLRQDTTNPQLNQGLIGAFVLTRTLSRITLPSYCTAIVLNCGPPLGYLDWNLLTQLAVNGAESAVMYAATAKAMDVCMERGWISRFPG